MIFNKRQRLLSENIKLDYSLSIYKANYYGFIYGLGWFVFYFKNIKGYWEKSEILSEGKSFILHSSGFIHNKRKR